MSGTGRRLSRSAAGAAKAAPVRALHLGLGAFHRSHQAWYTAGDPGHGIAAYSYRDETLPTALERQDGLFTLLVREDAGARPEFSRELAPLAGFYPSVWLGAAWWFLDAPRAMRRFRDAVTETAGFHRCAGFVDDTRGFTSIPVRHDTARRVDAGYLAGLVAEHTLTEDEAATVLRDLHDRLPREAFRLEGVSVSPT